jgi:iron(III) transport system ATP-binding protein
VLQIDTPEDVYRRPKDRFVAEFVGHCNFLTGTVERCDSLSATLQIDGAAALLEVQAGGLSVGTRVTVAVRPESVLWLADAHSSELVNTYTARARTSSFLGDHYQYEFLVESFGVSVSSATAITGDPVQLHIPPSACSIVAQATSPTTSPEVVSV